MTITIGTVVLDAFEVPQKVTYGGRQRLVTHHLADGRRLIDVMGPEELDVRFKGTATGPSALERVRRLDRMRSEGERTVLRWSGLRFPVIVREVALEYRSDNWIDYELSCAILDSNDAPVASDLQPTVDGVSQTIDGFVQILDDSDQALVGSLRAAIAQADHLSARSAMQALMARIEALETVQMADGDGSSNDSRAMAGAKLVALTSILNAARAFMGNQRSGGGS